MNRSLFGETTAGWIVNASWAWHASYWRSWIWQTWWLAGTSFSPPLLWWIPQWRRWSDTPHSSLWRAPWARAVNAPKTNNSTRFIFLWKGSHSPCPKSAGCAWLRHWNPLECSRIPSERIAFLEYSRIQNRGNAPFSASEKKTSGRSKNAEQTSGLYFSFQHISLWWSVCLSEEMSSILNWFPENRPMFVGAAMDWFLLDETDGFVQYDIQ